MRRKKKGETKNDDSKIEYEEEDTLYSDSYTDKPRWFVLVCLPIR